MIKRIFISLFLVVLTLGAVAQSFPEPMRPARLVNDFAGMLSSQQNSALENKLAQFNTETSTQIAIVTVKDLDGLAPSDYAARLFDKWGVGGKGKDNGVLVLVKPKTIDSKGEVFIATGYGVEGAVPDALAGRIVDYDILPAFRNGHYYEGLNSAVGTIMGLTRGEFTADEYVKRKSGGLPGGAIMFLALIALMFLRAIFSRRDSRTLSSKDDVAPTVFIGGLPFLMGGSHRSGGGDFGGFGGFGGGMSGGGGAGGSW